MSCTLDLLIDPQLREAPLDSSQEANLLRHAFGPEKVGQDGKSDKDTDGEKKKQETNIPKKRGQGLDFFCFFLGIDGRGLAILRKPNSRIT